MNRMVVKVYKVCSCVCCIALLIRVEMTSVEDAH